MRFAPGGARRIGAFTLIELLVVISIIALLISILLPALSAARTEAWKISSVSSARQVTTGLLAYTNDFKQQFPFLKTGTPKRRWNKQWPRMLIENGYVSDLNVFWSPGRDSHATGPETIRSEWSTRPNPYTYECVSYGMNTAVSPGTEAEHLNGDSQPPLILDQAGSPPPSDMVLLAESFAGKYAVGSLSGVFSISPTYYKLDRASRLFNYNGGIVRAYVDGRAHGQGGYTGAARISGRDFHVNNPRPTADELGWNVKWPAYSLPAGAGPGHQGYWRIQSLKDVYHNAPWFTHWRTSSWHLGLRDF